MVYFYSKAQSEILAQIFFIVDPHSVLAMKKYQSYRHTAFKLDNTG